MSRTDLENAIRLLRLQCTFHPLRSPERLALVGVLCDAYRDLGHDDFADELDAHERSSN